MLRNVLGALFVMAVSIGLVAAKDFTASITKVNADKNEVTYQKYKKAKKGEKPEKDGDPVTATVTKEATIATGKFNKADKKFEAGDKIEGGLKASVFQKIGEKGVLARITASDDGKTVSQILVIGKKKDKDK
jgi:hypothetical protein